ncbi:uncharacterized protein C8Q71DRAFT_863375 [Rhodofomes roseus]|uniref:Uncharacterized protein n=1 Tax=Rhodofomes roseus TaxID=34475 RepID=A0ABQ8JYC7_9APHY|nr:uncharacterized protein C8Q71DRAFT_863375 [Rhodofomes roseus]KAH9829303.1 hypothetical protein C8Q71DRAFT_863375 [Rhodofomes roseus]
MRRRERVFSTVSLHRIFLLVLMRRIVYIGKGIIASVHIILAVVFALTLYTTAYVGAVIEWVIAFGYTFYLLMFYYDLRMSHGMHKSAYSDRELLIQCSVKSGGMAGTMCQVDGLAYGTAIAQSKHLHYSQAQP